jgi:pectate lyase
MFWNQKKSRVFHAAVGLWCGGLLLTACGASPEDLQQPGEEQLIQQEAALGGAQSYTAYSQKYDDLLVHRTGFALDGNVVGAGANALVYVVDKTTDDGSVGTLRHALESTQPYWIRFAPALAGQSITVTSSIAVQSNKTIDGRLNYAQPVRIKTNSDSHVVKALVFDGKTQLIVMNVNFDDGYDGWKQDAEGSEAIHITDSNRIWLHQNRFARFRDVAVEMDLPISDLVTMTYNLFERQYQAVVIRSERADFHHNRCLNSGSRCPRMGGPDDGGGNLYAYNNLIEFWREDSIHFAAKLGKFLAAENVYNPRTDTLRLAGACGGTSDIWMSTENLKVGKADVGACIENQGPYVQPTGTSVTFFSSCSATPPIPMSVNLEPASDALAAALRNNARPQAYVVDNSCR